MRPEPDVANPMVVGLSWLVAAGALPGALVIAVIGQGLGAVLGGCHWIGVSLPVDRQVWALVNQPTVNFASLPAAAGYWLGSLLLPVIVVVALLAPRPRRTSIARSLVVIQWSWCATAVAVSWLPLIDLEDGHLTRWLALHDLPAATAAAAPVLGALLGLWPTTRLLALARRRRPAISRRARVGLVALHLVAPTFGWLLLSIGVAGGLRPAAAAGLAGTAIAALVGSALRFPPASVRPVTRPTPAAIAGLVAAAVIVTAMVAVGGRPVGPHRSGVLWGEPRNTNNIRQWVVPPALGGGGVPPSGPQAARTTADPSAAVAARAAATIYCRRGGVKPSSHPTDHEELI